MVGSNETNTTSAHSFLPWQRQIKREKEATKIMNGIILINQLAVNLSAVEYLALKILLWILD